MRYFLSLVLLVSSWPIRLHAQQIKLNLNAETGNGPFYQGRSFGKFIDQINQFKIDSSNLKFWGVWKFSFDKAQSNYLDYLKMPKEDTAFNNNMKYYSWDTAALSKNPINCTAYFLAGKTNKNQYIIIYDANNDRNFTNDQVYYFPSVILPSNFSKASEQAPHINTHIDVMINNEIVPRILAVQLVSKPFLKNVHFPTQKNIEDSVLISIGSFEYKKKDFFYKDADNEEAKYTFYYHNLFPDVRFNKRFTEMAIAKYNSLSPAQHLKSYEIYHLGDTIRIGANLFKIKSISQFGDSVLLTQVGKYINIGITSGTIAKSIIATDIDSKLFKLSDYRGAYILLEFWGTWCGPCKALTPELKKLNTEYNTSKFSLKIVGIALDEYPKQVKDYIKHQDIQWSNIFQKLGDDMDKHEIVKDYKVTSFPTFILISKTGKILNRTSGTDGFYQIKNIISRLGTHN